MNLTNFNPFRKKDTLPKSSIDQTIDENLAMKIEKESEEFKNYDRNESPVQEQNVFKKWVKPAAVIALISFFFYSGCKLFYNTAPEKKETVGQQQNLDTKATNSPATSIPNTYADLKNADKGSVKNKTNANPKAAPLHDSQATLAGTQPVTPVKVEPVQPIVDSGVRVAASQQMTKEEELTQKYINSSLSFFDANGNGGVSQGMTTSADATGTEEEKGQEGAKSSSSTSKHTPVKQEYSGEFVLKKGTLIPATLVTGIQSDVTGQIIAQVRQDVYDSVSGMTLLIPAGSRLVGHFDNNAIGGNRIAVTFTEIVLPDGHTIHLDTNTASDKQGYPGMHDLYSNHKGTTVKNGILTALMAGVMHYTSGNQNNVQDKRTPAQEASAGALADVLQTFNSVIGKEEKRAATVTIRPGYLFNVTLTEDIGLPIYIPMAERE